MNARISRIPSRLAATLFALAFALICAGWGLLAHPVQAHAAETDADGTVLADGTGPQIMGFNTSREGTLSMERGNADPAGTSISYVPTEVAMLGAGAAHDRFTVRDYVNSSNMTPQLLDAPAPAALSSVAAAPGKMVGIDVNGDLIDETAYLHMRGRSLWITVCDPRSGAVCLDELLYDYSTDFTFDIEGLYPVQSWTSIFNLAAADLDGDACEDLVIVAADPKVDGAAYGSTQRCTQFFFSLDEEGRVKATRAASSDAALAQRTRASESDPFQPFDPVCLTVGDPDHDGCDEAVFSLMDASLPGGYRVFTLDGSPGVDRAAGVLPEAIGFSNVALNEDSMLSVAFGDVDSNGVEDLVIGGFSNDWLFLAFAEWDVNRGVPSSNVAGKASSLIPGLPGADLPDDYTLGTPYNDTDSDYIPAGLHSHARYSNTCNWTVPLYTVGMQGLVNGRQLDKVFFGTEIYQLDIDNDNFKLMGSFFPGSLPSFGLIITGYDDNNLAIMAGEAAVRDGDVNALDEDDLAGFDGSERLVLQMCFDRDEEHGGDLQYEMREYFEVDDQHSVVFTRTDLAEGSYFYANDYPKIAFQNLDGDALRLDLLEHQFIYTEPMLIAAIMSPPFFRDIFDETGYDCGSTTYTQTEGSVEESTGFCSLSLAVTEKWGTKRTKAGPTLGGKYDGSWTSSTTKEYWYSLTTGGGQDSVALSCVPVDAYFYRSFVYDIGSATFTEGDPVMMTFPCDPVTTIMPVDDPNSDLDYTARVRKYNDFIDAHNGSEDAVALDNKLDYLPEVSEFVNHSVGEPSTYRHMVPGLKGVSMGKNIIPLDHGLDFGTSSQSTTVIMSSGDSSTYGGSFIGGLNISREKLLKDFGFDLSVEDGGSFMSADYAGATYVGLLNSVPLEYNDYYFTCNNYAGTKEPARTAYPGEGNDRSFAVIDYVVSESLTCPPAQARNLSASHNKYDSLVLSWDMPWDVDPVWNADSYALERYDVAAGAWIELTRVSRSAPVETAVYTDKGLEADTLYRYRVVARVAPGSTGVPNPTPLIEAWTTEPSRYEVGFRVNAPGYGYDEKGSIWAYRLDELNERYSFESPGSIERGVRVQAYCIPDEGFSCVGWNVYADAGYSVSLNDELEAAGVDLGDDMIDLPGLEGPLYLEAQVEEAARTADVQDVSEDGPAEDEGAPLSAPPAADVLAIAYEHDGRWTTDPEVRADIQALDPAALASLRYVLGGIEQGRLDSTPIALKLTDDGDWLLPTVAFDHEGRRIVRTVRVMKDAVAPELALRVLDQPTGTTTLRQQIAVAEKVGASGVARVEMRLADDPNSAWIDVTDSYRGGLKDLEGGTYAVRLTTGAGVQVEASATVAAPHGTQEEPGGPEDPGKPEGPGDPEGPEGPGEPVAPEGPGGSGASTGSAQTVPASGKGDGSALAPTGDPARFAAAGALAAAALALGALALARRRG